MCLLNVLFQPTSGVPEPEHLCCFRGTCVRHTDEKRVFVEQKVNTVCQRARIIIFYGSRLVLWIEKVSWCFFPISYIAARNELCLILLLNLSRGLWLCIV